MVIGGSSNRARLQRELSLMKSVVGIFLTFVASYLPITLVQGLDTGRALPHEVYFVGALFLWLSPSINWVIYGLMNAKFARAYRYLLCATGSSSMSSRQRRASLAWPLTDPLSITRAVAGKVRRNTDTPGLRGNDPVTRKRGQRSRPAAYTV